MARCFLSQNDSFYLESLPIPNFPSPSRHSLYYTDHNGLDEEPNHFLEPKINGYQPNGGNYLEVQIVVQFVEHI